MLVIGVTALTFLVVPLIGFVTGVLRAPTELRNARIEEQASELNRLKYIDSQFAELRKLKLNYEGRFDDIARLVVRHVAGTTTTCRAKVLRIGDEELSYDASWGDRAEATSLIAPGASDFINLAYLGEFKGGADEYELMPIRVGKRVSESSGAEFYRPYNPRDVSTVSPLRFTLIVSADSYPDESDRVVVEVGLHYPRDSLRTYLEVVDVEHLVGGSPEL